MGQLHFYGPDDIPFQVVVANHRFAVDENTRRSFQLQAPGLPLGSFHPGSGLFGPQTIPECLSVEPDLIGQFDGEVLVHVFLLLVGQIMIGPEFPLFIGAHPASRNRPGDNGFRDGEIHVYHFDVTREALDDPIQVSASSLAVRTLVFGKLHDGHFGIGTALYRGPRGVDGEEGGEPVVAIAP